MKDKRMYLLQCKDDYRKAVQKAQMLYSEIYDRVNELDYLSTEFLSYLYDVKNGKKQG
jgi:hypothetical protein